MASTWEHWTDYYTTLDTRFFFHYMNFDQTSKTAKTYDKYFDAESGFLDPIIQFFSGKKILTPEEQEAKRKEEERTFFVEKLKTFDRI